MLQLTPKTQTCNTLTLNLRRKSTQRRVALQVVKPSYSSSTSSEPESFLGAKRLQKKLHLAPIQSSGLAWNSAPAGFQVFPSRLQENVQMACGTLPSTGLGLTSSFTHRLAYGQDAHPGRTHGRERLEGVRHHRCLHQQPQQLRPHPHRSRGGAFLLQTSRPGLVRLRLELVGNTLIYNCLWIILGAFGAEDY